MDGSSGTKSVPRAVLCAEVGLSDAEWEESLAVESFLAHPKTLKDIIEINISSVTAAQAFTLLFDLARHMAELTGNVTMLQHPDGPSLRARNRTSVTASLVDLPNFVAVARTVLAEELTKRMFGSDYEDRPSDTRLVQIYIHVQAGLCRHRTSSALGCAGSHPVPGNTSQSHIHSWCCSRTCNRHARRACRSQDPYVAPVCEHCAIPVCPSE